MSFNQYRTNPGQAVSNFKGRTDTPKAWPSTAVSTWMNGGLFGGASTPQWEVLTAFRLVNNSYDIDISSLKADYAAVSFVWVGQATSNSNEYPTARSYFGSSPRYPRNITFTFTTNGTNRVDNGSTSTAARSSTGLYEFKRGNQYTFWGLADQPSESWGEAGIELNGFNATQKMPVTGTGKNNVTNWDRVKFYLGSVGGNIDTSQVWLNTAYASGYTMHNRLTVWGLKAQREALS